MMELAARGTPRPHQLAARPCEECGIDGRDDQLLVAPDGVALLGLLGLPHKTLGKQSCVEALAS